MLTQALVLAAALTSFCAFGADFYSLSAKTARGKPYPFEQLKGKVVVIANTASKCGYTPQYKDLQGVEESYAGKGVVVLGMPSNSFSQEDLDGAKAADFCELNHGVKFTILEKADIKGASAHPVFKYLTEKAPETGDVKWNFEKFIIDGTGQVVARFPSQVAPSAPEFKAAIEKALAKK
jgi:glutathione peroxidase